MNDLIKEFAVTRETLEKLIISLNQSFNSELHSEHGCDMKMLPTFVRHIPDGSEEGDYFALDLGGTNFRLLLVNIKNSTVKVSIEIYSVSEELMRGTGEQLFDYIAKCLGEFVIAKNGAGHKIGTVGFTFSFPAKQESLTSGLLLKWTKGFNVTGVVEKDVCELLLQAVKNRKVMYSFLSFLFNKLSPNKLLL